MTVIYGVENPQREIYIGQTQNYKSRFKSYKNKNCLGQPKIYESLCKYNPRNHLFVVLEELGENSTQEYKDEREKFYVDFFRSKGKGILNVREPGSRGRLAPESIEKWRRNIDMKIHLENLNIARLKRKPLSKEHFEAFSFKGRISPRRKIVVQLIDNKIINEWASISLASEGLNYPKSNISKICNGERVCNRGYDLKFKSEL